MWKKPPEGERPTPDHTAIIGEGSEIDGKYTFTGTLILNGHLKGEIVSNDRLMIGAKGIVNATIRAGTVLIEGEVTGNVSALERVELCGNARVYGDIEAPVVSIEPGVLFEGHCRMTKSRPIEVPQQQAPQRPRDFGVVPLKRSEVQR
jgi:cytoskeletal protein CcmA (bactofilin family)